jgi:pimeloyl-ACP methyl ester carboxylesterase
MNRRLDRGTTDRRIRATRGALVCAPLVGLAFATVLMGARPETGVREVTMLMGARLGPDLREVTVRVGDAEIRALCTSGPPRVALLHDAGADADAWLPVLRRLEGRVGACAYDRRGSGGGAAPMRDRGWYELLDELRRVHVALGLHGDYVLVGHGLGGLYGRVYAMDRPGDVAGLVLVDPAHEDMPRRVRAGMPRDEWSAWMRERARPNADGVVEERVAERARRLRLPRVRVTVITASLRPTLDGWESRFVDEAARRVHSDIVDGVEMGRHLPASHSGHDVPRTEPQLVADEILRIVRALEREGRRTAAR